MKFVVLNKPGTIDWFHLGNEETERDADVARFARDIIREHDPSLMFVHLGDVDDVGHRFGWGSKEQSAAVERADGAVGEVLAAWRTRRPDDEGVIVITSDHGGAGREHKQGDNRALFVPWVLVAPGALRDHDLTLSSGRPIQLQDTAATVVWLLDIGGAAEMDGKPVLTAFESPRFTTGPASTKPSMQSGASSTRRSADE
jgi:bisphosphoglycerate-independent phosphoglycerate mutase (AlkP superfamily)